MRIVFAAIPAYGHLYPVLPLAMACAAAGHDVRIAAGGPFLDRLPLPTIPGIPAGAQLDGIVEETRRRHPQAHGHEMSVAMFADTTAKLVSATLDGVLGDLNPDLVVFEAMNIGAAMAADVHDVPAVGFAIPAEHRGKYDVASTSVGTDPRLTMQTRRGTGYYKVPSLKGVWYRGPFEHNGSVATLEDWFDQRRLRTRRMDGDFGSELHPVRRRHRRLARPRGNASRPRGQRQPTRPVRDDPAR